jgi:hypothetical protein
MIHPAQIRPGAPVSATHARAVATSAMAGGMAQAAPGLSPSRRGIVAAPDRRDLPADAGWVNRGFPWGRTWAWGIEMIGATALRFWNPAVMTAAGGIRIWGTYDAESGRRYLEVDTSSWSAISINVASLLIDWDQQGDWPVANATTPATAPGVDLLRYSSFYNGSLIEDSRSKQRIDVAHFNGRRLVTVYLHSGFWPQVWMPAFGGTP